MAQYTSNRTERHYNAEYRTQSLSIRDEQGRALRELQRSLAERIRDTGQHGRKARPRTSA